jgi:signal transduction histidine kinase
MSVLSIVPTASQRKGAVSMAAGTRWKSTVLLVDDEPDVLSSLSRILAFRGYAVDTASSIAELLGQRRWEDYVAGVFDRRLPDGMIEEAIPAIRERAPGLPIIIATGYADIDGTIKALRERVEDYLIKPVNPDLLTSRLRSIQEAREAQDAIDRLEREVIRAAEEEKRRVALEIHDGLGSLLGGVGMLARALGNALQEQGMSSHAEQALSIETHVLNGLRQARALSHGLYAVAEHPGGLSDSLREMAAVLSEAEGVVCNCGWEGAVEVQDPIVSNHLFRIAQEAARNAIKHGRANVVRIDLRNRGATIELTVSDDGGGFESGEPPATGLGLRSMHYRCRAMDGNLAFSSTPEGGVEMRCSVPLGELR